MPEMEEPKTKEDIKQLLKHLEDEHRKASISDKTYKELKEKYKSQMSYMENTIQEVPTSQEEIEPEQAAAQAAAAPSPAAEETGDEDGEKKGFFGKIKLPSLKRKTEAPAPAPAAAAPPAQSSDSMAMIEIEKIKTMLDAIRDQKKATDESIQSLFENVGEVRSMSIQNDANEREINSKLERITDDVTNLRPKEIEKKFNQINETLEKYQLSMEKVQAKTDDMSQNLNKLMENFKVIGNMENLANINTNVQSKLADIQEAMNYTERLASKAEKLYIDLKMELEDIVIYKSKQEGLDEAMRDVLKTIDAMNTKFDNYTTRKDTESERQDIMILGKETESLKNALALVQTNVPEPILNLRKEREDINIFLDSLEEQHKTGKVTVGDYEMIKKKNMDKLKTINGSLEREWKNFERLVEKTKSLPPAAEPAETVAEQTNLQEEIHSEVVQEVVKDDVLPQPPTPEDVAKEEAEMVKEEVKTENVKEETPSQEEIKEDMKEVTAETAVPESTPKELPPPKNLGEKMLAKGTDEEMIKGIKEEMEEKSETKAEEPKEDKSEKTANKKEKKKSLLNLPF